MRNEYLHSSPATSKGIEDQRIGHHLIQVQKVGLKPKIPFVLKKFQEGKEERREEQKGREHGRAFCS